MRKSVRAWSHSSAHKKVCACANISLVNGPTIFICRPPLVTTRLSVFEDSHSSRSSWPKELGKGHMVESPPVQVPLMSVEMFTTSAHWCHSKGREHLWNAVCTVCGCNRVYWLLMCQMFIWITSVCWVQLQHTNSSHSNVDEVCIWSVCYLDARCHWKGGDGVCVNINNGVFPLWYELCTYCRNSSIIQSHMMLRCIFTGAMFVSTMFIIVLLSYIFPTLRFL